mgnify:CR=1 FL=1
MSEIYVLLSHQLAQQKRLDQVAQNMANIGSSGYKQAHLNFAEYLGRAQGQPIASYAKVDSLHRDFSPGALQTTNNDFDFAIKGEGFFAIKRNGVTMYTRNGEFTLNPAGQVVTQQGDLVLTNSGEGITVPFDQRIELDSDGTLIALQGNARSAIGRLAVWTTDDAQSLIPAGNAFVATQPLQVDPNAIIIRGVVESSNVNAVSESVALTQLSKAYELTSSAMQRLEDTQLRAIRQLGQPSQ